MDSGAVTALRMNRTDGGTGGSERITRYLDPDGVERDFVTPDGVWHKTWGHARRHLTGSDLLQTIKQTGPSLSDEQARRIRDALLRYWHVSRRRGAVS